MNIPVNSAVTGGITCFDRAEARMRRCAGGARTTQARVGLAMALTVAASLACAQAPNTAIKEFGLIGTWADDCNTLPGPSNQHATFSVTSRGLVLLRNDFGPNYGDMLYRVVDAKRISSFRLSFAAGADH
jgi:hypothetical protein